jgi:hypothetical protein
VSSNDSLWLPWRSVSGCEAASQLQRPSDLEHPYFLTRSIDRILGHLVDRLNTGTVEFYKYARHLVRELSQRRMQNMDQIPETTTGLQEEIYLIQSPVSPEKLAS